MNKREQLARAYSERFSPGYWEHSPEDVRWRESCFKRVDWFLDELMEPGEEALRSGQMEMPVEAEYWMENRILHCKPRALHKCVPPKNVWQAILTQIRAGKP